MPSQPSSSSWALTTHLLTTRIPQFTHATQSPFLRLAASGSLPKSTISHWLANDRLYMQGYIRLTGHLLRILRLPAKPTPSKDAGTVEVRLLDWLVDALVNIRREERFFMDVAERYGLNVDIADASGVVPQEKKIEGLRKFKQLFALLTDGKATQEEETLLPWLEGLVLFWATEKVYFEAWSWAKEQSGSEKDPSEDADGGAMRREFIPNWTNEEFIQFVDTLEGILNEGVEEAVGRDEEKRKKVVGRAEGVWEKLLDAEGAFWPIV